MADAGFIGRRRAVRTAHRAFHRLRHAPVDRFGVKGIFLTTTADDFYRDHFPRVVAFAAVNDSNSGARRLQAVFRSLNPGPALEW
jgi:hypothetical protein